MTIDSAFIEFPRLSTERLLLRQVQLSDKEALFSIRSDPEVRAAYGTDPTASPEITLKWIRELIRNYAERKAIFWCITFKDDPRAIGSCTLWNMELESFRAELGYELNRSHWRMGIMYEALTAVLSWCFDEMELNRIEACPLDRNVASKELLRRLGFRFEGDLKERIRFHDRFEDQLYFRLLKSEWLFTRKES